MYTIIFLHKKLFFQPYRLDCGVSQHFNNMVISMMHGLNESHPLKHGMSVQFGMLCLGFELNVNKGLIVRVVDSPCGIYHRHR